MQKISPILTRVVLAMVFSIASTFIYGQSYVIYPNDSITDNAPFNQLSHFTIQQNNNSGNFIMLEWEQISVSIPIGWTAYLCDYGNCFSDFPLQGIMDTVYNLDYGLLSVAINPGTIAGVGFVQYAVWDISNPSMKDTLTWIISASASSGIPPYKNMESCSLFPTISNSSVTIQLAKDQLMDFKIIDRIGKIYGKGVTNSRHQVISIADLPAGMFYVWLSDLNQHHTLLPFLKIN